MLAQQAGQRQVFEEAGLTKLVRKVVEGYHSTIFAYGQTGSGKTFTMEGYKYEANDKGMIVPRIDDAIDTLGIVQRCARVITDEVARARQHRHIVMTVSYMEIYNEKIYDLLNSDMFRSKKAATAQVAFGGPQGQPSGLKLKWNDSEQIYSVENLF